MVDNFTEETNTQITGMTSEIPSTIVSKKCRELTD
jgi:hypothetical protein